jgi:hypothetical protein
MSDLNYGLGFYLIEVEPNQYDLFNSATDKRILLSEPKEKIISFLEFNLPSHPFLRQADQEHDAYFLTTSWWTKGDDFHFGKEDESEDDFLVDTTDYSHYHSAYSYDNNSLFNYDYGVVCEGHEELDDNPNTQMEFNFTYKDLRDKENISPSNSPSNEEDVIPYLPNDTEGDTE